VLICWRHANWSAIAEPPSGPLPTSAATGITASGWMPKIALSPVIEIFQLRPNAGSNTRQTR